jgi:4-hydroxy-3-methylbut-2-en-1-yl diphosphate synthase IspG/GcpE
MFPGLISCPHCGRQTSADENSIYHTHALSKTDEARLLEKRS